ncbi:MAG: glutamine synthetase family protein [Actinomycetota bacterium]|nr:glutamine synthetase family protein [Actinomycetota bacterium]MDQ6945714.1 glutamine synthetase family protein [Actinomycetota bacterium]
MTPIGANSPSAPDPDDLTPAAGVAAALAASGIVGLAVTVVDNSGVARVKGVPVARLTKAVATGIGAPPVFDAFGFDGSIASVGSPIGDLRLVPDLDAVVPLAGQPGWAWAPADRFTVDGSPYPGCQRSFARRMSDRAAEVGVKVSMAFETEWVVDAGTGTELVPPTTGPAYGMGCLVDLSAYAKDLLDAFAAEGVQVEQIHPEYAPAQMELSVSPLDPVGAADRVVLVRQTLRAVSANHGYRVSLSPAISPGGVGSGAHLHLSIWTGDDNLFARGHGAMPAVGEAWLAGILDALPALLAVGAPSVASYLRLQPQRWAAPWRCWGAENREAALRVIAGSASTGGAAANAELKVLDASSNPYLVVGAVIAAGLDGIERDLRLPPEVTVDPAGLDEAARSEMGIARLPTSLSVALDAFDASAVIREAMGPSLADTWSAVRRSEVDRFADATEEDIALASRWVW